MKYLKNKNIGLLFIILIFILVVAELILRSMGIVPEPIPTAEPIVYQFESLPDEWEFLWMDDSIVLKAPSNRGSISLGAGQQSAFALDKEAVVKIDLLTGEVSQCSSIDNGTLGGSRSTTLLVNQTQIFVGFNGTQKISGKTEWGAGRIEAYDADSCIQTWSRTIGGVRSLDVVIAAENTVSVDGNESSNYYLLDATTGAILETLPKEESPFVWKIEEDKGIAFIRTPESSFIAKDRKTNENLWISPVNYGIYQPPVFTDNVIVARVGSTNETGRAIAVNVFDGSVLWEVENIVGNVAVSGAYVFLITTDARLLALDIVTGEVVSEVNFVPNEVGYSFNDMVQIAVSENVVLVYFGYSSQLIALRF